MGLFDSIASVFTTAQTNKANLKAVKMTNEANANLWREQTAYNAPEAQMKRLEAAGLNPNMVYGTIGESKASNPPAMDAPHYDRPEISGLDDTISRYQQVVNMQAHNAQVRAASAKAVADAKAAAANADYLEYETKSLKDSGMIKGDSSPLKFGVRRAQDFMEGASQMIDRSSLWKWLMDSASDAAEGATEFNARTPYMRWRLEQEENK